MVVTVANIRAAQNAPINAGNIKRGFITRSKTPPLLGIKGRGPPGDGVPVNVDALGKSYHRIRREQIRINFRRDKIL
jgi:hypothetical protein